MRVQVTQIYLDWINSLRDRTARARIQMCVDRLVHGNPGQYRSLTAGVRELKIDVGPGYRVYFVARRGDVIILLAAATSQSNSKTRPVRDAATAQVLPTRSGRPHISVSSC